MAQAVECNPAAAVLIAGSAQGYSNLKKVAARSKVDKSKPGNLQGSIQDVAMMYKKFQKSKIIDVPHMFSDTDSKTTSRNAVLTAIESLFNDGRRQTYILYYSGHGGVESGNWCLGEGEFISLDNILQKWDNRNSNAQSIGDKLVVIADCCFSGQWVTEMRQREANGNSKYKGIVFIQAACGDTEMSEDTIDGGVFTKAYADVFLTYERQSDAVGVATTITGTLTRTVVIGPVAAVKDLIIMNIIHAFKTFTPTNYPNSGYISIGQRNAHKFSLRTVCNWTDMSAKETESAIWWVGSFGQSNIIVS